MKSNIYKRILVATDGSKLSECTLKYAIEIARISGARLYAVYVVDTADFASIPMESDAGWETMYSVLRDEGKDATQKVEELAKKVGVEVEQVELEGHPSEEIVQFANKENMDIIILGTHGKSGLSSILMGSVAENVIRTSTKPILVVPAISKKDKSH
ncbi:universal stress protein [Methanosalsum natronophilum]|uniref:Universal stress protein n=1 Tax=Methanosalsum natronophilum TaxID=768733 RepID=A0A3R7X7X4_9EURY|nr:universal stress protein [Methanosalsum natronophilum]MCS3924221.1 nucleotide-binding universal stress UspA family protein [Methanosalsum natronophilum]RQD92066.1 MAG: universal stress protein [Methanosalsum natronophilum]